MSSLSHAQLSGGVSPVLTEHACRRAPGLLINDRVFAPLSVKAKKGQLCVWDNSNLEIPDDAYRPIGSVASEAADPEPGYVSYTCHNYSRRTLVTQEELDIAEATGVGAEQLRFNKTQKIVDQLLLLKEKALADKLNTAANYDTSHSTVLSTTWAVDGGNPIGDIETGLKQGAGVGIYYNAAIMDYQVWVTIARHGDLLDLLKYTRKGMMTEEDFFSIWGLKPIIAKSVYNSGGTFYPVWQDSCILAHVQEGLDRQNPGTDATFGRTLEYNQFSVIEYDAPDRGGRRGAYWIEAETGFAHQFIGVDNSTDADSVMYLIDNAI